MRGTENTPSCCGLAPSYLSSIRRYLEKQKGRARHDDPRFSRSQRNRKYCPRVSAALKPGPSEPFRVFVTPPKRSKKKGLGAGKNGVASKAPGAPALDPDTPVPARSLAHLCGVDLKTVHQWAVTGLIPHFRTPGRHLRFRPQDVAEFLKNSGHPGATEVAGIAVVLVVAPKRVRRQYTRQLKGSEVHFSDNPFDALVEASRMRPNAVVVDTAAVEGLDLAAYLKSLAGAAPASRVVLRAERGAPKVRGVPAMNSIEEASETATAPAR